MSTNVAPVQQNVIWKPNPGSQTLALTSPCQVTLYHGTRGPGKTDAQLMRFRSRVGIGYGPFWRGIIFDREYKHLDDLVSKSKRWYYKFNDGAKFLESNASYKWVWPTGEELLFRSIKTKEDYDSYHGQEYPFIGWNELTKYPTSELFQMMMSCNRSSFTPEKDSPRDPATGKITRLISEIPLEVFATCNPYGPGHNWVKNEFIDVAGNGKIVRRTLTDIFNPRTQQKESITITQVAIFGSYKENPYLSPLYIATLTTDNDENRRKSWLEGDWEVVSGGAIDDVWRKRIHVKPRFQVPIGWIIDRSFDWGSTHPFSVGWWAEANGEEATYTDPKTNLDVKFCPPKGTLVQIGEWYGTEKLGSNKGLKIGASKIAEGIKSYEIDLIKNDWIQTQPKAGPADNQIRDVREDDVDTIEKKMADKGIRWEHSDKSPGSRKIGLELLRERLKAAMTGEGQAIYYMDNCVASIATLPVLPRDPEKLDDVDTDAEDHPYDMVRYRVLKGNNRLATKIKVEYPN